MASGETLNGLIAHDGGRGARGHPGSRSPTLADALLRDHVPRLASLGKAVLLVEQRARATVHVASWTSVLASGTTRLEGRPPELLARDDFEQLFLGAGQAAASEPEADDEENQDI